METDYVSKCYLPGTLVLDALHSDCGIYSVLSIIGTVGYYPGLHEVYFVKRGFCRLKLIQPMQKAAGLINDIV